MFDSQTYEPVQIAAAGERLSRAEIADRVTKCGGLILRVVDQINCEISGLREGMHMLNYFFGSDCKVVIVEDNEEQSHGLSVLTAGKDGRITFPADTYVVRLRQSSG